MAFYIVSIRTIVMTIALAALALVWIFMQIVDPPPNPDTVVDHAETIGSDSDVHMPGQPRCPNRWTTTIYKSGRMETKAWCS